MDLAQASPDDVLEGRYRLVTRVGQGGFGDVWRAVELLPDGAPFRDVALKLLSPEVAAGTWADEAKLLASFSHPSLVTIFAAGILAKEQTPFVAMELLHGESLAERLRRTKTIPWRAALHFARQVAAALDVIHSHGVVHLDLKPANLFVTEGGTVKVLDFGISRREGGRSTVIVRRRDSIDASLPTALFIGDSDPYGATQAAGADALHAVAGTPGFVAPEVLERSEPTSAADAYALGATIVQLVTGRLPHAVSDEPSDWTDPETVRSWWMELREATLRGHFRDLEEEGIPRGLASLTRRLLSVDPEARACPPGTLAAQLDEVWARPYGVHSHPYPGLEPFDATREGTLPGRDGDLARMLRDLTFEPVVVTEGPRGGGKTSLVAAGLVPGLAKARVDDKEDWRAVVVDPATLVDEADLARLLRSPAPTTSSGAVDEGAPSEAAKTVAEALALPSGELGVALVLDPLESLCRAPDAVVSAIAELVSSPRVDGLRVIGCLDAEANAAVFERFPNDAPLRAALRYLGPPSTSEAGDVALGPARRTGARIENPELVVDAVEAELKKERPALPFVGAALARWYADAGEKRPLSGTRFVALGGVKGAVLAEAQAVLRALSPEDQPALVEVLLALTATDGSRVERPEAEVVEATGDDARGKRISGELVRRHLVTRRGESLAITHEALTNWPHLESARLAAMDRLAFRERLREASSAWERSGLRREYLDRGALLRDLGVHRATVRRLSPVESEFVEASRRSARRRTLAFVAALGFIALCVAGVLLGRRALEARRMDAEQKERVAQREAYLAGIIAKARRSADPYVKVALVVEAMQAGANEASLGVELFDAAERLAPARVLSLDAVKDADFPWNDRFIVGQGRAGSLVVIDLKPTKVEPDVIEHVDIDFDPLTTSSLARRPKVMEVVVGASPIVEIEPFAFDTAIVTRSVSGEVKIVRLREDGTLALAASPPMACGGNLVVAERAPVVACTTVAGVEVFDLRDGSTAREAFQATGVALSADGTDVVAWSGTKALFFRPHADARRPFEAKRAVMLASFSPHERAAALVGDGGFEVVSLDGSEPHAVVDGPSIPRLSAVKWDAGGADLALCSTYGSVEWRYLRKRGRAKTDAAPSGTCSHRLLGAPAPISDRDGFGQLATKALGTHLSHGGFALPKGRFLSRSMLLFSQTDEELDHLLAFDERERDDRKGSTTLINAVRSGDLVAVERANGVSIVNAIDGRRMQSSEGHLLGMCPRGRVLAWKAKGTSYEVFDVRAAAHIADVPRTPGIVVGASPDCSRLYTEDLDGTLRRHDLERGESKAIARLDGYVFDVKQSAGAKTEAAGLLASVSSGAVIRLGNDDSVRVLAYATPYATAIADGPGELESTYADASGIAIVRASGQVERIVEGAGTTIWEDIAPMKDKSALVLAAADQISVVDLARREIVLKSPHQGLTRFAAWDDEGSFLAYSPDVEGASRGVVLPFGQALAMHVGAVASNLRVKDGRLVLKE